MKRHLFRNLKLLAVLFIFLVVVLLGVLCFSRVERTLVWAQSNCAVTPINYGQVVNGTLATSDCRSPLRTGSFADRYSFAGASGQAVTVTLNSTAFDAYLYLLGPDGLTLAESNDSGGAQNARIFSFVLPANGTYVIEATAAVADQTGDYRLTLSRHSDSCNYAFVVTGASFNLNGGSGSVTVTASNSCIWQAVSLVSWLSVVDSGTGNGTANFTVAANPGLGPRTGLLVIAGQDITITQTGCVTFMPSESIFEQPGGTGTINVTTGRSCNWTASTTANWLAINAGASGSGNATVNFTVTPNTSPATRATIIRVGEQDFRIGQAGNCSTSTPLAVGQVTAGALSNTDCQSILRSGTSGSAYYADRYTFNGTAGQAVTVAMSSGAFSPYLYLIGPQGQIIGRGSELLTSGNFLNLPTSGVYVVEATSSSSARTGNYRLSLMQGTTGCNYALTSPPDKFNASGGSAAVTVSAGNNCAWQAFSDARWLTITTGASGNGNGTVNFTIAANSSTALRFATLVVAGRQFTIAQAGNCTVTPLVAGQTVNGALATTDCFSTIRNPPDIDPTYRADYYSFTATAGQGVVFTMGAAFDTYLYLIGPEGRVLTSDDDSGEGLNSRLPSSGVFTLPSTGTYILEATTYRTNTTGTYRLNMSLVGANCTYAVAPTPASFDARGSTLSVNVTTGSGCQWQAISEADWISVNSDASGSGNGTVNCTIAANPGSATRRGALTVAGRDLTVEQGGLTTTVGTATTVSSASYEPSALAAGAIASTFGTKLATTTQIAATLPLPTNLAGTILTITDSNGQSLAAPLLFVSPTQINFVIPDATSFGAAELSVRVNNTLVAMGELVIKDVAPAVFSANASGRGLPVGLLLRVAANGTQTYESLIRFNIITSQFEPVPVIFGPSGEKLFLILYPTGIRHAADPNGDNNVAETVRLLLDGRVIEPLFAGAAPGFAGLDQLNAEIPRDLSGRGRVNLQVAYVAQTQSNTLEIEIGGTPLSTNPTIGPLPTEALLVGQPFTINGAGFMVTPTANLVELLNDEGKTLKLDVMSATATQLNVILPFGAAAGPIRTTTPGGQAVSSERLRIRTSVSGVIQDTAERPLGNMAVRSKTKELLARTDAQGKFVIADVAPSQRYGTPPSVSRARSPAFQAERLGK